MKILGTILAVAAGVAIAATGARSETVLRVSTWTPPTHFVNAKIWPQWGEAVKKATGGRVTIKQEYNLASPLKQFAVTRDGVAHASFIFHGYNTRFVATQIVEMPGLGTSAEAAAVAYTKVHEKHLAKANEHRGVEVIGLQVHGQAVIQTKKPLGSLAALKGMKIRVPGGVGSLVGKALGVTAVKLPAPKVYEALSTGVADGIFMPFETQNGFRLKEVTKFVTVIPGGLYYGSFAFLINPQFLKGLSDADRKGVTSTFGIPFAKLGRHWDTADHEGRAAGIKAGTKVMVADEKTTNAYYATVKPLEEAWAKKVSKWFDGKAALAELRKEARAYDKAKN